MKILIINHNTKTQIILNHLLNQLKVKTILTASTVPIAKQYLHSHPFIEMILSDDQLLQEESFIYWLSQNSMYQAIPLIRLLNSSSQPSPARVDYSLLKPFGMHGLQQAMEQAFIQRNSLRNELIFIHQNQSLPLWGPWKKIHSTSQSHSLDQMLKKTPYRWGGILIDPVALSISEKSIIAHHLNQFKKTPLGSSVPIIGFSHDPLEISPYQNLCQFIYPSLQSWEKALLQNESYLLKSLNKRFLTETVKQHLQKKEFFSAHRTAKKMLKLHPYAESYLWLGKTLEHQKKFLQAAQAYQNALEQNPYLSSPYFKILSLGAHKKLPSQFPIQVVLQQAKQFLSTNPHLVTLIQSL